MRWRLVPREVWTDFRRIIYRIFAGTPRAKAAGFAEGSARRVFERRKRGERMEARCHVELLGGLQVRQSDRVIARFSTQKTGALLAYLAYYRCQRHPRDVLID